MTGLLALMLLAIAAPPDTIAVDVRGAACALERRIDEPLGALGLRRVPRGRPAQLRLRVDVGAARLELVLVRAGQPKVRRSLPRAASCAADVDAIGWVLEAQLRDLGFTPPPRVEVTPAPSLTPAIPPRNTPGVVAGAGPPGGVGPRAGPPVGAGPPGGVTPGAGPSTGVAPGAGPTSGVGPSAREPDLGRTSSIAEAGGRPNPERGVADPRAGSLSSSVAIATAPAAPRESVQAGELASPAPQGSPGPPSAPPNLEATTAAPRAPDAPPDALAAAALADTASTTRDPRNTGTASTAPSAWTLRAAALALVETGPATVPGVELRARLAGSHGLFAELGVGWRASRSVDVIAGGETRGTLTLTRFALLAGAGLEWALGPGSIWAGLNAGADLAWATSQGPLLFRTTSAVRVQPVLGGELGYTLDLALGPLRGLLASAAVVARPGSAKFIVEGGTGTLDVPDWSATFRIGAWLGVP